MRRDNPIVKDNLAIVGVYKTSDTPECGGLATSARSNKGNEFTLIDIQGKIVGGLHLAEFLREILDPELRHTRSPLFKCSS